MADEGGHNEVRKLFGSDRAQLVYGKRPDGTLAHISEVVRGLSCGCVCPACDGQLVARLKEDHRVPHFAHHGGEACGGGPETVLHLLAKEALRSSPTMVLPGRPGLENKRVVTKPTREVQTQFLRMEYTDPKKIIPDLYVRALGYDLFVEVAVTHFADAAKIQRLREHNIPAVEIDLSKLPRDSLRDAINEAVLKTATRRWLYHPGIEAAWAKQDADELEWQQERGRREAAATAKHRSRVEETAAAYRKALAKLVGRDFVVPRQVELDAIGLATFVGRDVPGFACFSEPPSVWQAIILAEVFHDRCLGNAQCKPVPIVNHLEKRRLIEKAFLRVFGEVADDVTTIDARFAPAWKAVDNYLKYLLGEEVLITQGFGVALAPAFAKPWSARTLAENQRTALIQETVQRVGWILGELPEDERAGTTVDQWLQSIHQESGLTYDKALRSEVEAPKIIGEIATIVQMLEGTAPLFYGSAGLPISHAISRRKARMEEQAEVRRQRQLLEASRLRHSRRDRLCVDAETELDGADRSAFLHTNRADMNDMTPVELAEDSESGLTRAREALAVFVDQRRREAVAAAEKAEYQDKIRELAEARLSPAEAIAFLKAREDDIGAPLQYVKDERTFQKACARLTQWENQFGSPF
ncbi:competence protein CoiA family protein [Mesorhizobium carmichaelinearum]|uniref:competence protein CoiA family protein n=1 Tax=Mesorhizobium carmichaelinearum TaxID=1208188 RepID=UPI00117F6F3C|nr:competence protein CoiA family protein [Mesorhizobium carmichaelinearum]